MMDLRKPEFDKLDQLYSAIHDIDIVIMTHDEESKLDDIWHVIEGIDKSQFDATITDNIIDSIRNAILLIYESYLNKVNSNINVSPADLMTREEEDEAAKTQSTTPDNVIDMKHVVDNRTKGVM